MGLFEKLQTKLELYRLQQRYTRRDKRTTFISDAVYVDGEYVYSSPSSPSRKHSNSTSSASRRWSKMPAVGIKEMGRSSSGRA
ncbi:hypothetical protein K490DRAFT_69923 [Saccharata proteae CBS 121410]|uniref:Uncharacterized protein n=1 Tax=Saccharata proteae CBS 121410 TaxID=1314787 RepID=A0A9P4LVS6_9PEZI|nr:hypothetical protein K490DRAFT_69923 [Saccharata proteae CBS 121410]